MRRKKLKVNTLTDEARDELKRSISEYILSWLKETPLAESADRISDKLKVTRLEQTHEIIDRALSWSMEPCGPITCRALNIELMSRIYLKYKPLYDKHLTESSRRIMGLLKFYADKTILSTHYTELEQKSMRIANFAVLLFNNDIC